MIGGLLVDLDGRTNLPGLWAVGECASSGLHGANRMGSNSLLEGMVLGLRSGTLVADEPLEVDVSSVCTRDASRAQKPPPGVHVNVQDIIYSLKSLMWRQVGVERTRTGLEDALSKIRFWSRAVTDLGLSEPRAFELVNMLTLAHLSTLGALAREESRGTHFRSEFPEPSEAARVHSVLTPTIEDERLVRVTLSHQPVRTPDPVA
jgi:L-aspartate oxidase